MDRGLRHEKKKKNRYHIYRYSLNIARDALN